MGSLKTSEPKCLWRSNNILGEGTLWVKEHNSIYFVDIKKKQIHILNIKNNNKRVVKVNKQIGFLAHINKHVFILGLQGELRVINLKSKKIIKSILIEKDIPLNRINDGKTDPEGKLWFGTMDNPERSIKNGSLYCLDKKLILHKVDRNYFITNGPAFIDSKNFYHTDSRAKTIYKIKINNKLEIIKKKIFKKFKIEEGSPDGMTLDRNKNLWVAHYRGAKISVFNKNGKKVHEVEFPAKNITNCIFGGRSLSSLYVTTAKKGMNKSDLKNYNLSGSFFKIDTNVRGFESKKFNCI